MQKKYQSPFKRIAVTKEGGEKIQQLQNDFDHFWKKINRLADKSPEKFHAMKAMQEACQWLTRACALKYQQEMDGFPINSQPAPHIHSQAPEKSFQNNPQITFKRSKI